MLQNGKVLVICGEHDAIIVKDELIEDAKSVLKGHVDFKVVNGGHEFPITKSDEVVEEIVSFWNGSTVH